MWENGAVGAFHLRPSAPITILLYDLRASGVTRNAIRIAHAARIAGLDARLWPLRPQGDLIDSIPPELPVEPIRNEPTERQRDLDCALSSWPLRVAIAARKPAILFSAGNQMHIHAARVAGPAESRPFRFVGRASNAIASAGSAWRAPLRPLERFQYAAMDRIVAVSGELGGDLADRLGQSEDKVRIIPNGVDVEAIRTRAMAQVEHAFLRDDGVPLLLAVGRLSRQKNFEGLVRAFAIARAVRPMRLLILAPGPLSGRDRLRSLAAELGVSADVAVEGFAANPYAFMARADLFVLSSLWEGASNVLLEALACGCPVVAARAPTGVAEVMQGGALGPLVPPGDDPALAMGILERLKHPRDEATLIARARDYDLGRTLEAYVELLDDELAAAPSNSPLPAREDLPADHVPHGPMDPANGVGGAFAGPIPAKAPRVFPVSNRQSPDSLSPSGERAGRGVRRASENETPEASHIRIPLSLPLSPEGEREKLGAGPAPARR